MDNSHAPYGSPSPMARSYFIGYLRSCLQIEGQITPQDWESALRAADDFQREAEIDITNYRAP